MVLTRDSRWKLGIAKSTYAGYENGYRLPSLQSLSKIADLFDTSVDYILGRIEHSHQNKDVIDITRLLNDPDATLFSRWRSTVNRRDNRFYCFCEK